MTRQTLLQIFKFASVGSLVAVLHLAFVYYLTSVLGWWYLLSTTISYTGAVVLNFFLQKFFVHRNMDIETAKKQFVVFVILALVCLGLNTFLMFVFVDMFLWHYLLSQALVVVFISLMTFFIYRNFIFK